MASERNNWPVSTVIPVAWGEMDSFGHVNNVVYFRYIETSRIAYSETAGILPYMKEHGVGPILADVSCAFIKPLYYPDTLTVYCRVTSCGTSSMVMEHELVSGAGDLVARGKSVIVMYDYRAQKKVPIPGAIRDAVIALEPEGSCS